MSNNRGRVIIRNLSFKVTEKSLKEICTKYGEVLDVNLPKNNEGKLKGFGFVKFSKVNNAAKFIKEINSTKILDRLVAVDWAIPKTVYDKQVGKPQHDDTKVKLEEIKEEEDNNDEKEEEVKEESEEDDDDDDDDEDESESESDEKMDCDNSIVKTENKPAKKISNDVKENKTIFIRNIPYDATENDLRDAFIQFGPQEYAKMVFRKDINHSTGTGFIKFKTIESANMCLQTQQHFVLTQMVYVNLAVTREEAQEKIKEKKDIQMKKQDTGLRNLYLLKEGLILSTSKAAEDVSKSDMEKRINLERKKTELLKNLSRFVSKERLTIHNIPLTWDNKQLIDLIVREVKTKPCECRIQRSRVGTATDPQGKSFGFAYVSFKQHEDALKFLRALNNNPHIFGPNNRPIVAFSIENRKAVEIKEKRQHISKLKNPNYQHKLTDTDQAATINKRKGKMDRQNKKMKSKIDTNTIGGGGDFSGIAAKETGSKKQRQKRVLNDELALHNKSLKLKKKQIRKERFRKILSDKIKTAHRMKKKARKNGDVIDNIDRMAHKLKSSGH